MRKYLTMPELNSTTSLDKKTDHGTGLCQGSSSIILMRPARWQTGFENCAQMDKPSEWKDANWTKMYTFICYNGLGIW